MAVLDDDVPGSGYGSPYVDSLIWGSKWSPDPGDPDGPLQLSYHFGQAQDPFGSTFVFRQWSAREMDAFRLAFQLYENVANIEFTEVANFADADLVEWVLPASQFASPTILGQHEVPDPSLPTFAPIYGFYNATHGSWANLAQGGFGFITAIHELGHALGLAHPHDGGDPSDEPDATTFPGVPFNDSGNTGAFGLNQGIWTTMTYNDGWDVRPGVYPSYGFQGTPMAFDIAALQALYGANTTYNTGDNVYLLPGKNGSGTFWSCIWDADGIDEISAAALSGACTINLNDATLLAGDPNAGGFVSSMSGIRGGFTIANKAEIENATGGKGNDTLTGNELANVLTGNAGNDSLDGAGGSDTMMGGAGNDVYFVDSETDQVIEYPNQGTDLVKSLVDFILGDNIERLELLAAGGDIDGTGNALNNVITGNAGKNQLSGLAGNDTLTGGDGDDTLDGGAGNDAMTGGNGDDVYVVDSKSDKVTETSALGGKDIVESSITYTLGKHVENLELTAGETKGTGNTLDNLIVGSDGGNIFDGKAGADTMRGGLGNDLYIVDATDTVDETDGGGNDTIQIAASFDLGDPSITVPGSVENLTLAGTGAFSGTGTADANVIIGNTGANVLDGKDGNDSLAGGSGKDSLLGDTGNDTLDGGAGIDTMSGAEGNDTYIVDNAKDVVQETGDGIDTIQASISIDLTLPIYDDIENVSLIGKAALKAAGDLEDNELAGNEGANLLSGGLGADTLIAGKGNDTLDGGADADSLAGGLGNDTYLIDDVGDVVTEAEDEGTDTVRSGVTGYVLGTNVENLVLLAGVASGTGNELKNALTGNDGDHTLDGGLGADTMIGGKGNDTYIVDDTKDMVKEASGKDSGVDTVISTAASYTLSANVENLILDGDGDIAGTGNTLNNILTGNDGDNTLNGGGGADTLRGGLGDDTYIIDAKDVPEEEDDAGFDIVQASFSIDLTLVAFDNIEGVRLTGSGALTATGDANANLLIGNSGANKLFGGAGDDTIQGGGGNDTLDGGAGNDTFLYTSKLDGRDIINGFEGGTTGQDMLDLDGLFDSLNVATDLREGRVELVDKGPGVVEVRVDVDGKDTNGAEFLVATLNMANVADVISVRADADIRVGTL